MLSKTSRVHRRVQLACTRYLCGQRERERDAHNLEVQIEVYCMYVCIHSWNVEFAASKFLSRCNDI